MKAKLGIHGRVVRREGSTIVAGALLLLAAACVPGKSTLCWAQTAGQPVGETSAKPDTPGPQSAPNILNGQEAASGRHRFWDKENDWLFAGVGASRTLDYFSTLNMRRRGDNEILLTNDVVDNHAAFAAIEAAGTGVSIGASYLFHRYEHHKLERWTSIIHIGLTTTGAVRNYCLKTVHTTSATPSR